MKKVLHGDKGRLPSQHRQSLESCLLRGAKVAALVAAKKDGPESTGKNLSRVFASWDGSSKTSFSQLRVVIYEMHITEQRLCRQIKKYPRRPNSFHTSMTFC